MKSEGTGGTDSQSYQMNINSQPAVAAIQQFVEQKSNSYSPNSSGGHLSKDFNTLIQQAVQNNDLTEINTLLNRYPDKQLNKIVDHRQYTLLHLASFNNSFTALSLLVEYMEKLRESQLIQKWVNEQTEDGFTSLHFCSYRGNIHMIDYLISKKADPYLINKHGMNAVHIAAQGDQPISIVFFRSQGVDTLLRDQKGGTPLHWAAFYGCEQAVNYLVSFSEIDLNLQDYEGLTPLHLSAMSGNSRVVRRLLIKGCNKYIVDKKNQLACDIAHLNEFNNIEKMLREEDNFVITYLNIRVGFGQIKRSKSQMIRFLLMFFYVICYESYLMYNQTVEFWVYIGFQFIVLTLFFTLSRSNPGYIKKNQATLIQLLRQFECFEICPDCTVVKVQRSKHCDICNQCVKVYDHHCPWVDNCIGSHNHCVFFFFIFIMVINISYSLYEAIYQMVILHNQENNLKLVEYIIQVILISFSIIINGLFVAPIWLLLYVQTQNLLLGKTTYERYSQTAKSGQSEPRRKLEDSQIKMCFQNQRNPVFNGQSQGMSLQLYDPLIASQNIN